MARTPDRVVVAGAGPAGLATVDALRTGGHDGEIVLVGEERHAPYDRPPLSKQVLAGTWDADRVVLRSANELADAGVDWRPSTRATGLDVDARRLQVDDGSHVSYDALVVATGVRARRFPADQGLSGAHFLRDLDDALALRTDLVHARSVAVVGAGFLGAEAAAVAAGLGLQVHLVDAAPLPMHGVLGDDLGGMLADLHAENGVLLHLGRTVDTLRSEAGRVRGLLLDDGTEVHADVVVVAIGATPAVAWLQGAVDLTGPRPDEGGGGVRCDATGRAADAVWAVGDVAAWWDPTTGRHHRHEHRLTAGEHGRSAARDILGLPPTSGPSVPYFWSDQFDLKLQCHGRPSHRHRSHVVEGSLGRRAFVVVQTDADDRVVAVLGAGRARAVREWRRSVAEQQPLASTEPVPSAGS